MLSIMANKDEVIAEKLKTLGLVRHHVHEDDHCLFRALAHQLYNGKEHLHEAVRNDAVNKLEEWAKSMKEYFDSSTNLSFDEYRQILNDGGRPHNEGNEILQVIALHQNVCIHVVSDCDGEENDERFPKNVDNYQGMRRKLVLVRYDVDGVKYSSTVKAEQDEAQAANGQPSPGERLAAPSSVPDAGAIGFAHSSLPVGPQTDQIYNAEYATQETTQNSPVRRPRGTASNNDADSGGGQAGPSGVANGQQNVETSRDQAKAGIQNQGIDEITPSRPTVQEEQKKDGKVSSEKQVRRCSNCKQPGHNIRSCKNPPADEVQDASAAPKVKIDFDGNTRIGGIAEATESLSLEEKPRGGQRAVVSRVRSHQRPVAPQEEFDEYVPGDAEQNYVIPDSESRAVSRSSTRELAKTDSNSSVNNPTSTNTGSGVVTDELIAILNSTTEDIDSLLFALQALEQAGVGGVQMPWFIEQVREGGMEFDYAWDLFIEFRRDVLRGDNISVVEELLEDIQNAGEPSQHNY